MEEMMSSGRRVPKFVRVSHGRRLSYLEMGCSQQDARRSLVVLHGLGSSRLAAMPGVSEEMLKGFGVRLVALDRPGYGQSDPDAGMTLESASEELEQVVERLQLGPKVFLLGFSCGGAYCYAAARYIPHRIAGIALWCPIGCFHWQGISQEDRDRMCSKLSRGSRALTRYGCRLPFFMLRWYVSLALASRAGEPWVRHCRKTLSPPDRRHLELQQGASDLMLRSFSYLAARCGWEGHRAARYAVPPSQKLMMLWDNLESISAHRGYGMARDLHLVSNHWGFELQDIAEVYDRPIHIWQGDDDNLVPIHMQRFVKEQLPELVQLHELKGEGHLSWFCFNPAAHQETLSTLFGQN